MRSIENEASVFFIKLFKTQNQVLNIPFLPFFRKNIINTQKFLFIVNHFLVNVLN